MAASPQADWLDQVKWDAQGLAPAIAQDFRSGRVLMLAWVNRQALETARNERRAVYWSRSRGRLWRKGEESGHQQTLHGIYLDCDGDCVCYQVEQIGGIACHTGRASCFYRRLEDGVWKEMELVLKNPGEIYG